MNSDNVNPTISKVMDAIGLEIYSYLHPKDLFNLSQTCRRILAETSNNLISVALRQLPSILHDMQQAVEYQVQVSKEHSFSNRNQLLNHVLQKIEVAELRFIGQTTAQSLVNARGVLNSEKKPGVYGATLIYETPSFPDPEYVHVGYNYQKVNKDSATARCKNIIERMMSSSLQREDVSVVKHWLKYLLSQRNLRIGSWFWTCRHRNLDFQGVEGKGIMFSDHSSSFEFKCTIMTRNRVGEEEVVVNQIIPQFVVATRVDDDTANPFLVVDCQPLEAEVIIDQEDVFAVPTPFIASPSEQLEQAGIVIEEENVHIVSAEEEPR